MVSVPSIITMFISTPLILSGLGNVTEYIVNAVEAILQKIGDGATNFLIEVFNGMIWLIVGTPSPAGGGEGLDIFATPTAGSWAPFYDFFIESMQPLAILLLILQVALVLLFVSGPFLFSDYDKEKYFRRIFQSFVGVIAWWFMFTASTTFANELAMFLGGLNRGANVTNVSFGQFFEVVAQALLASLAIVAIGSLALMASSVLVIFVIVMYVARLVVIYGYSFSMPIFMALWPANIGFFKPISDLMKKLMELYIPILFLTLPNAIMIRATYLFAEAAVTPSESSELPEVQDGAGGVFGFVGSVIGDFFEAILFIAIALILPIIAVIAPKYVFQATSGSFGRVARSIERSRAMSQMGGGMGGGGGGRGMGGGGDGSGMPADPTPSGSGGGGGEVGGMGGAGGPTADSGMGGGAAPEGGAREAAVDDGQRDYEFNVGRANFSTERGRERVQRLSEGMGAAKQKVGDVKSKFESDEPTSTFQSVSSRQKSYIDDDGNEVPVRTEDPTTMEDMDDEWVQPRTAGDTYSQEELDAVNDVDTDGYESPEPYWDPQEAETGEGGMDVDPETDPDWIETDPEEYVGDTTFDVEQAQENGPVDRSDPNSPYYTGPEPEDIDPDGENWVNTDDDEYVGDTTFDVEQAQEDSPVDRDDPNSQYFTGPTSAPSTESTSGKRGSDIGYGGEDTASPSAESSGSSADSGGSEESRDGSDVEDFLSEDITGSASGGIDYEERN